jgi:hypothetical protein
MNAFGSLPAVSGCPLVAIPVCNEASNIQRCLMALNDQTYRGPYEVLLLLNNCTDNTAEVVSSALGSISFRLHIIECSLPFEQANAGCARSLAMSHAARLTDGVLLTTDADSYVSQTWLAANLDSIARGADAVAGRAEIDPMDAARLPARLLDDEARVVLFTTLLDRIDWLLDPDPADPWPRHIQHSGASIAVTSECYRRAGGVPSIPLGEDRAFFDGLRRIDAAVRHAPEVVVTVSGRLAGRAKGGMADTMLRRLYHPDPWLDDAAEAAVDRLHRATTRAVARQAWAAHENGVLLSGLAALLQLPEDLVYATLRQDTFGMAWSALERASPTLQVRRVAASSIEQELQRALAIIDRLTPPAPDIKPTRNEISAPAVSVAATVQQ